MIKKTIKLDIIDITEGYNVMESISMRESFRDFRDEEIGTKDLADILWAANGKVGKNKKRIAAPSSHNVQEITVYVFNKDGVYKYNNDEHLLLLVIEGDNRELLYGSQSISAPLGILIVSDYTKINSKSLSIEQVAALDAGIVTENIALFCSSINIGNVTRMTMNKSEIIKLLKLPEGQVPLINNLVGYIR
ncbi:MAG: nitroreductase family protein [Bacteroidales bacterium]